MKIVFFYCNTSFPITVMTQKKREMSASFYLINKYLFMSQTAANNNIARQLVLEVLSNKLSEILLGIKLNI